MRDRIKAFFKWVYNWTTVLTATIVGGISFLPDLLNIFGTIDLTPLLPPDSAARIITYVAIAKGIVAMIVSRMQAKEDA